MNIILHTHTKFKETIIHFHSHLVTRTSPNRNGAKFGFISTDNSILYLFSIPENSDFSLMKISQKQLFYTKLIHFQHFFSLLKAACSIWMAYWFAAHSGWRSIVAKQYRFVLHPVDQLVGAFHPASRNRRLRKSLAHVPQCWKPVDRARQWRAIGWATADRDHGGFYRRSELDNLWPVPGHPGRLGDPGQCGCFPLTNRNS